MVGVAFICCTFVAKIKCHSLNTVLFVNATIGFSENLFLVDKFCHPKMSRVFHF